MSYAFFPFFLIVAGLGTLGVVLVRRFPQIASLDVEKLPEEREIRTKKAIIEKQFTESLKRQKVFLAAVAKPVGRVWKAAQEKFRATVSKTYVRYAKTKARVKVSEEQSAPPEAIAMLLKTAENAALMKSFDEAEQKYIEVIRLSPRSVEAYRGLARLYYDKGQLQEAEELFLFILKLDPSDIRALNRLGMIAAQNEKWNDAVRYFKRAVELDNEVAIRHFDLGCAYRELGKHDEAMRTFERAVALESLNPKYLDAYLEEAIACGNRELAESILNQLKLANPDNKKLDELKKRVGEIGD